MRIDTSTIPSNDEEKIRAKEYWQQPGTQTLQYALHSHYVAVINRFIGYTGARKILEFGCGSGRNLEQIHKELNNQYLDHPIHLRGIDINLDSLEFGRKNFSSELDLILGDEEILANEPNAYFDLVFTVSVLDHIPNPRFVIQELLSKTKRYAIFLEPLHPEELKIEGKIEQISTSWSPQKDSKSTPYTYFHSYLSIFDDFGAKVLIDLPMPTSVYKLGPLYRLFVVEKKDFVQESKAFFTNLVEISEGMTKHAILTLSSLLRQETGKVTKHIKQIESINKLIDETKAELNEKNRLLQKIKQEALTQKVVADELLIATKTEAKEREERLSAENEALLLDRKRVETEAKEREERLSAENEALLLDRKRVEEQLCLSIEESQRLLHINEMKAKVNLLESRNTLSIRLGDLLLEGWKSPRSAFPKLLTLHKIWREYRMSPPIELGGGSFDKVIAAHASGGFDRVEKLLVQVGVPGKIKANAYTALARHLRKQHPLDAGEAARLSYEADPQLFRRKWLAFRLYDAGRVLEADTLLATLPEDIQFSVSERAAIDEVRDRAEDELQIGARAKVDGYLSEKIKNHRTKVTNKGLVSHSRTAIKSGSYYLEKYRKEGLDAILQELYSTSADKKSIASNECILAAKTLRDAGIPEAEYPLMKAAKELYASPATLRAFFWAAQREKEFAAACDAIHELEKILGSKISGDEAEKLRRMKVSPAYMLTVLRAVEPKKPPVFVPVTNRLCYVLHNSLPYSSGGYATRSHGVADGIIKAGFEVILMTRPGFPCDIKPDLNPVDVALSEEIDGISYMRILSPQRSGKSMLDYVLEAADSLEEKLREIKPEIVMAASNHVTGLPALIAARRLGLKFIYEVRGLWEITRMSRDISFQDSAAFVVQSLLESALCEQADHVFTLTEAMREELVLRGCEAGKINLMPNSCDPDRFLPREKDSALAKLLGIPAHLPVIGYVGTFVDYEGLEDLASACALLKKQGTEFRLLLVGNENASEQGKGPISQQIIDIAEANGFNNWLIMPGRVLHEEVENYYSLIDIAAFPRKPWPVCEMVSPMKPLEALAMEKAVLVSSVRALDEMIKHEETGLVFRKGDIESLAETLLRLINDPNLRFSLGKKGRAWVLNNRTWRMVGLKIDQILKNGLNHGQQ